MQENEDHLTTIIVALVIVLFFITGYIFTKENNKPNIEILNAVESSM